MDNKESNKRGQVVYFSHGGGPLPVLGDPSHKKMIDFMEALPLKLHKPESIIVFSAHWEENIVAVQSGNAPEILYDYYGFPEVAYSIKYPCKGNTELALRVAKLLQDSGIEAKLNNNRPYDHGSYIPLRMMYPDADIPVIQISLNHNLDPLTHLKIGKALRKLLEDNILIIGSGFSFHNMRAFDFAGREIEDPRNNEFQDRLIEICCDELDEEERFNEFKDWDKLPNARYCHPREEHLLPLHVCVGLSTGIAEKAFDDYILGKRAVAFLWRYVC